jgi:hypothetical protein
MLIALALLLVACGCPRFTKPYGAYLTSPTNYKMPACKEWKTTPRGTPLWVPPDADAKDLAAMVDSKVNDLESCLRKAGKLKTIRRAGFAVFIPNDWYISACSGEQLVPSIANYKLCEAKGLTIPVDCRGQRKPGGNCPCVCNFRATVQGSRVVVTAPNLKLFKAELARIVLYPLHNNPWADPVVAACVKP